MSSFGRPPAAVRMMTPPVKPCCSRNSRTIPRRRLRSSRESIFLLNNLALVVHDRGNVGSALQLLSRARVPLADAIDSEIAVFRDEHSQRCSGVLAK
jgi:hypothetical protein